MASDEALPPPGYYEMVFQAAADGDQHAVNWYTACWYPAPAADRIAAKKMASAILLEGSNVDP